MNSVVFSIGSDETAKATVKSSKTGYRSVNTNTNGDNTQHYQWQSHGDWSLMRSMLGMKFLVLCSPENTIIESEHIERCHSCHSCHNPTNYTAVFKTCSDNLILGTETGKEGYTCYRQTGDEEGDVCYGHVLTQASHC